ncbi:zinc finger protein 69 homolog [Oppia nitens]|uniref:zinc finger protein 69 homolog n=1 Tax=Oppia nitens TaxID=1686743 RepID=UPI0023DAEB10|nr:zinc finger protein 69 homolog [Oppia nitens]
MTSMVVTIDDILDQLWSENKRLLKELLFANKYLNILDELKSELNLIYNKFETQLKTEDKFNQLRHQLNYIYNKRQEKGFTENNSKLLRRDDKNGTKNLDNHFVEDTDKSDSDNIQEVENNNENQINDKNSKEVVVTSSSSNDEQLISPIKPQSVANNQIKGKLLYLILPPNVSPLKPSEFKNIKIKSLTTTNLPLSRLSNITTTTNNNVFQTQQQSKTVSSLSSNQLNYNSSQQIDKTYAKTNNQLLKCHTKDTIDQKDCNHYQSLISSDFDEDITGRNDQKIVTKKFVKRKCRYDGCDKMFTCRSTMWYHYKVYHPSDTTKTLKCQYTDCQFECVYNSQMKQHVNNKHLKNNKSFVCPMSGCNKLFKHLHSLRCHERLHTNILFKCHFDGCQRQFHSKGELNKHLAQHKSEPTLRCRVKGCPEKFFTEAKRAKHREITHNYKRKRIYIEKRCDWPGCDYFGKHLTAHMKVHSGNKPFSCVWPQCDKRFRHRINLEQHMNVHNNVKPGLVRSFSVIPMELSEEHKRVIIYYEFLSTQDPNEIHRRMMDRLGNNSPAYSTITKWIRHFKLGVQSLKDGERKGPEVTVSTPENAAAVIYIYIP